MKNQGKTFGGILAGVLKMEKNSILIGFLIQLGAWALCLAVLAVIDLIARENPPVIALGLSGIFAVGAGCLYTFLVSLTQFNTNLAVELSFGISRRRGLAASWVVTVGYGAAAMALAALLETAWFYGITGGEGVAVISALPVWGWLCLGFLPGAAGAFTMGILRRFGKAGGFVLWLTFMILCQTPQLLEITSPNMLAVLAAVIPVFLPLAGLAVAVIGTLLLYNANAVITNR